MFDIGKTSGLTNIVDLGTKNVNGTVLQWCCGQLGFRPFQSPVEEETEEGTTGKTISALFNGALMLPAGQRHAILKSS